MYDCASLIEESEKSDLLAAIDMYDTLSTTVFKDNVGLLHAVKTITKEKIMHDFSKNKINILLSTTVIEVGIDVSNATVMLLKMQKIWIDPITPIKEELAEAAKKLLYSGSKENH